MASGDDDPSSLMHDFIEGENAAHQAVIYSKSHCPWCRNVEMLFRSIEGLDAKIYQLDQMKHGNAIQEKLCHLTGLSTVPNVFVNQQHVGSHDDVVDVDAHNDKRLFEMLKKVKE